MKGGFYFRIRALRHAVMDMTNEAIYLIVAEIDQGMSQVLRLEHSIVRQSI